MFRAWSLAACWMASTACSGKGEPSTPAPPPPPIDAAPADTVTELGGTDPDKYLDPDPDPSHRAPAKKPKVRASRPIDITLRSSPTGATAFVDNVEIGTTPTFWFGESDGRNHEFTFVLRGHGVARYKFVPVQSGTVHAKLEPVLDGSEKTGIPKPPATSGVGAVKPPDTVLVPKPPGHGATGNGGPGAGASGNGTAGNGAAGNGAAGNGAAGSGSNTGSSGATQGGGAGSFGGPPPALTGSGGSKIGPQP